MKCLIKNTYYKSIPGNNNYLISLNKDIVTYKKEKVSLEEELGFVNIEMYGKSRKVHLDWLSLISYYEVNLPKEFQEKIFNISFLNCDCNILRSDTGKIMKIHSPIIVYRKYRIIPNFTDYAISKESELIDIGTGRVIPKFNRGKFNYPEVFIYSPEKNDYKHIKVHRLVALAWINNNDFDSKPIVNHKDYNKQNNHYLNLEWCTLSHNVIHGKSRDICKSKVVPCVVKNHLTGEVRSFPTFNVVSSYVGVKYNLTPYELKRFKKPKLYNGFYEIKEGCSVSSWYYDKLSDPLFDSNFTLYISENSKVLFTFYTTDEAIKTLNIKVKNKSIIETIKAIKEIFPLYKISFIDNYHLEFIECKNLITNEVYCAENWSRLTKLLCLNKNLSKLNKYLKIHEQIKAYGFIFRYKSNDPWNMDAKDMSVRGKKVIANNIYTNEILVFESHTSALEYFNIDIKTILRRMNKNKHYNGWIFKGESENQFYLKAKPVMSEKI